MTEAPDRAWASVGGAEYPGAMLRPALFLICAVLAGAPWLARHPADAAAAVPNVGRGVAPVDFVRDVRPILSDRCFICHGPDALARQSDLRLDSFEGATADLGGYAAIVPGSPEESELLHRVSHGLERERMPPVDSKLSLSVVEIETLQRWIAEGARYAKHWAFEPVGRPEVPPVHRESWPRDDFDGFVLARLESEGLEPTPEASRETWLRRVSFDLTGLPPTLEELDAFLADESEGAHERVVDRLLASPRYGERMASDWLDAARYADSYGYQNDVGRDVWPWRDWVIDAFNRDLGWDRFATWQLAGDLLPEATREQRLATTFNRLHRQTNEGGSVEEEYRVEYVADRVHTFGTAFLGLTLECARCHDHKYDPIRQSEYYGLAAFFDNIDESGLYSHFTDAVPTPTLLLASEDEQRELVALRARVDAASEALERARAAGRAAADTPADADADAGAGATVGASADSAGVHALEGAEVSADRTGAFDFESLEDGKLGNAADAEHPGAVSGLAELAQGHAGLGLLLDGENNAHFPGVGAFTRDDPFTLALWLLVPDTKERAVVLHRSRAWTDSGSRGYELLIEQGALSAALIHFWPGNAIRVRTLAPLPTGRWVHLAVTYDGSSRAAGLGLHIDGERAETRTVRDNLTRTIVAADSTLTLGQRFRDVGLAGGRVDELRVFARELGAAEIRHLATGASLGDLLSSPEAARDHLVETTDGNVIEHRAALREARAELSGFMDGLREIMTMSELDTPRPTYRLERGSYLSPAERVEPGTPAEVAPFPADLEPDRLGLARWLSAPENPLFARVAVNRFWRLAFGEGLVTTAENFGSQGVPPVHAELLDHLARQLRGDDWSVKALMKRLVLSSTYRQSSGPVVDPSGSNAGNRLFAHGPRRRLSAEMIRDQALFVSGLLVERLGGPPVKPYQPPGLWEEKSGLVYTPDAGEGLWRRSLYTFWKRTSPPPSMMLFDAAKRDVCVARRESTSSPLQALALWNDPQLVEAARVLAERVRGLAGGSDASRLETAFRLVTSRRPAADERDVLLQLLEAARGDFTAAPDEARALLAVGAAAPALERDERDDQDAVEVAAWAVVAQVLLSYDGAVTLR